MTENTSQTPQADVIEYQIKCSIEKEVVSQNLNPRKRKGMTLI